ncbi:hypothetical protein GCM10010211_74210 [Streptomyces albospinus]|uniref:Phosphatidic acid phosphatase type 2/haloperoxidase domain-containing protein n=1 Tax=Streptomyces albospinus TaxID=285515 RepID=A0ABQ2VLB7_9ACTN|nr:phosphatase PAP2 family protein [Streptomyces albospinus]GGU96173.1 hypothetical protein GCM10010211_74210 [Streptomyces albospinus]
MAEKRTSSSNAPERLALWTGRLFAPPVLPVAAGCALSWRAALPAWGVTAAGCAVLGVMVIVLGVRRGWWSDWELSRRAERPLPLACATTGALVVWLACWWLGAPRELLVPAALAPLGGAAFLVCTRRGKVSLHTSAAAGGIALLSVEVSGWCAVAGVPLLALVGWSRVRLGAHTARQVSAGGVLGAGLTVLVLWLAG